jgi:hypothetical protein
MHMRILEPSRCAAGDVRMTWWVSLVVVSQKKKSEFLLVDPIPYRPGGQDRGRARICYTLTRYNYKSVRFVADHSTFKEPEVGCGADRAFEKFNVTQVNLSLCN